MEQSNNNTILKGLVILLIALLGLVIYRTESLKKQVSQLSEKVEQLTSTSGYEGAIESTDALSTTTQKVANKAAITSDATASYGRVIITVKERVENRYVSMAQVYPKVTKSPEGVVIVAITVDQMGDVTSAKIKAGTTIVDEDILDACKEAALRTDFSINFDAPYKQSGTITYTFTAR